LIFSLPLKVMRTAESVNIKDVRNDMVQLHTKLARLLQFWWQHVALLNDRVWYVTLLIKFRTWSFSFGGTSVAEIYEKILFVRGLYWPLVQRCNYKFAHPFLQNIVTWPSPSDRILWKLKVSCEYHVNGLTTGDIIWIIIINFQLFNHTCF